MADLARDIIAQADRMRSDRSSVDATREEIREFIAPMAQSVLSREAEGTKTSGKVLDNTAETYQGILTGAIVSTLAPDTVDWAGVKCEDEDVNAIDEAAAWLEDCSKRMSPVFRSPRSGFFTTFTEVADAASLMGGGTIFTPFVPGRGIVFTTVPTDEVSIDEDPYGRVDTLYRDYTLTARQAVQRWGVACPEKVRKAAADDKTASNSFRFVHAVFPREDRDAQRGDAANLPIASLDVCVDEFAVVEVGGFHEMPYHHGRLLKRAGEKYGRGCGHRALADVKSLQKAMKIQITGAEKVMSPPLLVVDDGVTGKIRSGANGITYIRSGAFASDPVKPLNTGARPDLGEQFIEAMRSRIGAAFYADQVRVVRTDRMTATEYLGAMEENNRILGPILGRLKDELIGPMVERVFAIMLRMNAFLPIPDVLQGRNIVVNYVSPLVRQQRINQARSFAQFMEVTAPLIAQDKEVLANLRPDNVFRDVGDVLALPKTWFEAPEVVAQGREARAKQVAAQIQHQQTLETVDTGANAVRALPALKQALGEAAE